MDEKLFELLVEIKGEVGEIKGLVAAATIAAAASNSRIEKIETRTADLESKRNWAIGAAAGVGATFGLVPHLLTFLHP